MIDSSRKGPLRQRKADNHFGLASDWLKLFLRGGVHPGGHLCVNPVSELCTAKSGLFQLNFPTFVRQNSS